MTTEDKGVAPVKRAQTLDEAIKAQAARASGQGDPGADGGHRRGGEEAPPAAGAEDDAEPVFAVAGDDGAVDETAIPHWVDFPQDPRFKIPPGAELAFLRFRAEWCNPLHRHKGDRVCVMWALNSAEEKVATKRSRGDQQMVIPELTKQSVRAIDGQMTDWTGKPGPANALQFWDEVGPKCRPLLVIAYKTLHSLSDDELKSFFSECFAVRTSTA